LFWTREVPHFTRVRRPKAPSLSRYTGKGRDNRFRPRVRTQDFSSNVCCLCYGLCIRPLPVQVTIWHYCGDGGEGRADVDPEGSRVLLGAHPVSSLIYREDAPPMSRGGVPFERDILVFTDVRYVTKQKRKTTILRTPHLRRHRPGRLACVLVDVVRSPGDGVDELLPVAHALPGVVLYQGQLLRGHPSRRHAEVTNREM